MTAEVLSSRRARRLGLISETVNEDSLDETVHDLLAQILKNGPEAVSAAKQLSQDIAARPIDDTLLQDTSELIANIRVSPEGQEGLTAFLEKRSPSWREESEG